MECTFTDFSANSMKYWTSSCLGLGSSSSPAVRDHDATAIEGPDMCSAIWWNLLSKK